MDEPVRMDATSQDEARATGHDYVGTEHILLGILTKKHGAGATIIHQLGLDQNTTEQWLTTR